LLRHLSIPGVFEFISIMIVESYANAADTILSLREKNIQNLGEMSWDGEDGLKSQEQLYHIATVCLAFLFPSQWNHVLAYVVQLLVPLNLPNAG
jgi:hypothetical protein